MWKTELPKAPMLLEALGAGLEATLEELVSLALVMAVLASRSVRYSECSCTMKLENGILKRWISDKSLIPITLKLSLFNVQYSSKPEERIKLKYPKT